MFIMHKLIYFYDFVNKNNKLIYVNKLIKKNKITNWEWIKWNNKTRLRWMFHTKLSS